ncbi:hypothetical protein HD554DRAFT_836617 [Boletus coccyginus]|nr:hypothetical protein HD554DRAFT_836617 [Boletus coccyginus]
MPAAVLLMSHVVSLWVYSITSSKDRPINEGGWRPISGGQLAGRRGRIYLLATAVRARKPSIGHHERREAGNVGPAGDTQGKAWTGNGRLRSGQA